MQADTIHAKAKSLLYLCETPTFVTEIRTAAGSAASAAAAATAAAATVTSVGPCGTGIRTAAALTKA